MNKRIYLCLAHMSETGMEQKYIQEAFDTNWVVPLGPNVNGFEEALEHFLIDNGQLTMMGRQKIVNSQQSTVNRKKSLPSLPVQLPSIWLS